MYTRATGYRLERWRYLAAVEAEAVRAAATGLRLSLMLAATALLPPAALAPLSSPFKVALEAPVAAAAAVDVESWIEPGGPTSGAVGGLPAAAAAARDASSSSSEPSSSEMSARTDDTFRA